MLDPRKRLIEAKTGRNEEKLISCFIRCRPNRGRRSNGCCPKPTVIRCPKTSRNPSTAIWRYTPRPFSSFSSNQRRPPPAGTLAVGRLTPLHLRSNPFLVLTRSTPLIDVNNVVKLPPESFEFFQKNSGAKRCRNLETDVMRSGQFRPDDSPTFGACGPRENMKTRQSGWQVSQFA